MGWLGLVYGWFGWLWTGYVCWMGGLYGVGLILGGTFGWFTLVPGTGLVESKELGWYMGGLGNKLVVWVVSVLFGVVLG